MGLVGGGVVLDWRINLIWVKDRVAHRRPWIYIFI